MSTGLFVANVCPFKVGLLRIEKSRFQALLSLILLEKTLRERADNELKNKLNPDHTTYRVLLRA